MLAVLAAICFLLGLIEVELGTLGPQGFLYLGLFLLALELAFGGWIADRFTRKN